jgi:hypothetical protein
MLADITGSVDEGLPLRNEYLVTENHILHPPDPRAVMRTVRCSCKVWIIRPSKIR